MPSLSAGRTEYAVQRFTIGMVFILNRDRLDSSSGQWEAAFASYTAYLKSVRHRLPESAYEFAAADWHYDFGDHRAPHDGWLESVVIREPFHGDRSQYRTIEIIVRLLAAYHDGHIELTYKDVQSYMLSTHFKSFNPDADNRGHQDWLYDEVRVSKNENVLHEIEWERGEWLIECKDISYKWLPAS